MEDLTILSEELNSLSVGRSGFISDGVLEWDGMVLHWRLRRSPFEAAFMVVQHLLSHLLPMKSGMA